MRLIAVIVGAPSNLFEPIPDAVGSLIISNESSTDFELLAQPFDVVVDCAVVHIDLVIIGCVHRALRLLIHPDGWQ